MGFSLVATLVVGHVQRVLYQSLGNCRKTAFAQHLITNDTSAGALKTPSDGEEKVPSLLWSELLEMLSFRAVVENHHFLTEPYYCFGLPLA